MASLWANIKKRRGSSHANLTTAESSKTQSARSSHNVSREESSFRSDQSCAGDTSQEEMQPSEERWARISKFAEQVLHRPTNLPQVRLPPSFYKGLKSATLPRHFRTKSKEAPIPPNTPEIQPSTSKQPSFESPRQVLKVFQKRAASVSPSRIEGDDPADSPKHKSIRRSFRESIRGISAERLPKPIRNFIRSHKSKSLPPERHPPKPSRRPGPVGKSWVKVYDDITYMDDPSVVDIQPIVGYTGHPTKIPDAQPLPAAPTPPPQRSSLEAKAVSTSSVESEYDNVPKRKRTHKPAPIIPVQIEPKDPVDEQITTCSTGVVDDNQQKSSAPTAATRTGRSREVSRYKGKRLKRTSTPINRPSISDLDDGGTPEREVSDHHVVPDPCSIVPGTIKPKKPKRGSRIVPEANGEEPNVNEKDLPKESKNIDSDNLQTQTTKEEPYRPKRGIKIYESIIIIEKEVKKDTEINGVNETSEVLPPKPKRGIKIYETIQIMAAEPELKDPKVKYNDGNIEKPFGNIGNKNETDKYESSEPIIEMPPRPTRGSKIYATVKGGLVESKKEGKSLEENNTEERIGTIENNHSVCCNGDFDDIELRNKTHSVPVYAKVNKSRDSMELSEKNYFNDSVPPPIPPKKRKLKNAIPDQESIYDLLPPRPQRHLKPKVRSLDPSPARPKRLKTLTLINGESNTRSEIENSKSEDDIFSLDDYGQKPSKPKRQTKVVKIEDVTRMIEENKVPLKPSRYTHGRLPAPPRRKKVEKSTVEPEWESQREQIENLYYKKDHYENVNVIDGKTVMKSQSTAEVERKNIPKKKNISEPGLISENSHDDNLINNTVNKNFKELKLNHKLDSLYRENSIGECGKEENELYKSIDKNLKNIECSFETLDEVIKSLKSYSSSLPSRIIAEEKNLSTDNSRPSENKDHSYLKGTNIDDLVTDEKQDLASKKASSASFECDASSDISVSDEDTVISVGNNEFIEDHSDLLVMQDSTTNIVEDIVANCNFIKYKLSCDGDKIIIKENIIQKPEASSASFECDASSDISLSDEDTVISVGNNEFIEDHSDLLVMQDSTTNIVEDIVANCKFMKYKLSCDGDKIIIKENIIQKPNTSNDKEDFDQYTDTIISSDTVKKPSIYSKQTSTFEFDNEEESDVFSDTTILDVISSEIQESSNMHVTSKESVQRNESDESCESNSVIVGKFPLKLPANIIKENVSSIESVVTHIPLKLSTTETATFKFEQDQLPLKKTSKQVITEIPIKLSTSERTTFKINQESVPLENNLSKSVITEIPLKLPTPEISTFKFETESSTEPVVTEIPVKLSTPELTTFKFEPETDTDKNVLALESVVTSIPVKLSTLETTTFKFEAEPMSQVKPSLEAIVTEIPVKYSTPEIITFKFEPESFSEPVVIEIPLKLSTPEIATFKFEPKVSIDNKALTMESVVTSIPVKLSTLETTTFKFEPESSTEPVVTEIPVKLSTPEISTFKFEPEISTNNKVSSVVTSIPLKLSTFETTTFKLEPENFTEHVVTEIPVKLSTPEITTFKFEPEISTNNKVLAAESVVTSIPLKLTTLETTTFKFLPESSSEHVVTEIPVKLSTPEITTFKFEPEISTDNNAFAAESVVTSIPLKLSTLETTTFKFEPESSAKPVVTEIPVKLSTPEITTFKFEPEISTDNNAFAAESVVTSIPLKLSTLETTTFQFEPESSAEPIVTEIPVKLSTPEITTFKSEPEINTDNKVLAAEPVVTSIPLKLSTLETTTFKFESESSTEPVVTEIPVKLSSSEITTFKFEPEINTDNKVLAVESVVTSIPLNLSTLETTTFKFEPESSTEPVVTEIPVKLSTPEITTFKFEPEANTDNQALAVESVVTSIPVKLSTLEKTTFKFEPESSTEPVVTEIPVKLSTPEINTFRFESETSTDNKTLAAESVVTSIPLKLSTLETTTFKFEPESSSEHVVTEIPVKLSTPEITTFKFEPETNTDNQTLAVESVVTSIPVKLSTLETTTFKFEPESSTEPVVTEIPVKLSTREITTFKFEPETSTDKKALASEPVVTSIPLKLSTVETTTFKFEPESSTEPVVTEIPVKLSTREITTFKFEPETSTDKKALAAEPVVTSIPLKLSTLETTTFKFEPESSAEPVVTEIPVKLSTPEITTFKFEPETSTDKKALAAEPVVTSIPLKLSTVETTTFKFEPESSTEPVVTEIPVKLSTSEVTTFKFEPETNTDNKALAAESVVTSIPLKLSTLETTTFKFEPESSTEPVVTEIPVKLFTPEITTFKFEPETNTDNQALAVESVVTSIPVKLSTLETTTFKFEPEISTEPVVTEIPVKLSTPEITTFKFEPETNTDNQALAVESVVTSIPVKLSTSETTTFKFEPESSTEPVVTEIPVKLSTSEITTFKFEPETNTDNKALAVESVVTSIPVKLSTSETTTFKFEPESSTEPVVIEIPVKLSTPEITTFKLEPETSTDKKALAAESVVTSIPLKLSTLETTTFKFEPESSTVTVVTDIPVKLSTPEITTFKFEPETYTDNKALAAESVVTSIPLKLSTLETTTFKFEPESSTEPVVTAIPVKLSTPEITTFKFEPETNTDNQTLAVESVVTSIPVKLSTLKTTTFKFEPEISTEPVVTEIPVKLSTPEITTFKFEPEISTDNKVLAVESVVTSIPVKLSTLETTTFKFEPESSTEHIVTEIPLKLPSSEITTYEFAQLSSTNEKALATESNAARISIKPSTLETASVKFEHEPVFLETTSTDLVKKIPLNLHATEIGSCDFKSEAAPQKYAFVEIEIPAATSAKELLSTEIASTSHGAPCDDNKLNKVDSVGKLIPDHKLESDSSFLQENEFISSSIPTTVSELETRLEGLRSQLEAVITNYPTSPSSSISSLDTLLTDNTSNRSSVLYTAPESPLSFYSPSQSTISMCSTPLTFYTAASDQSDGSLVLSDSDRTNTPSPNSLSSSIKADDEEQTSSGEEPGEL